MSNSSYYIEEGKKRNRASFILLQELQELLEEQLHHKNSNKQVDTVENQSADTEKEQEYMNLAIQAVDSMDFIYQMAAKTNQTEWANQILKVIEDYIEKLGKIGIEEVNAVGEYIDGTTMVSIGTVSQEVAPDLYKYQVFAVSERGFRYNNSKKLIREAKVITVY